MKSLRRFILQHKTLLGIAFIFVSLCGFIYFQLNRSEPSYKGKTLSIWIRGLEYENVNSSPEQQAALRAMGEPAVRGLIGLLEHHDSALKKWFTGYAQKHAGIHNYWIAPRKVIPEDIYRAQAASALGEIGPIARAAIPALTLLSTNADRLLACRATAALIKIQSLSIVPQISILQDLTATNWSQAALIVKYLGTNAEAAVPALIKGLQSTNAHVQYRAVDALGGIASAPDLTVPALTSIVQDRSHGFGIRRQAIDTLSKFRSAKKDIIPVFVSVMQEVDVNLWLGAAFGLEDWLPLTSEEKKTFLVPALKKSLESPDETIRANAKLFLERNAF